MNNEIAFVLPSGKVCLSSFDYRPLDDFRTAGVTRENFETFHFCDIWAPGRFVQLTFMEKVYPGGMAFTLTHADLDYINTYEYKLPGKKYTKAEVKELVLASLINAPDWITKEDGTLDVDYEETQNEADEEL